MVLSVADLNSACKASFSAPLAKVEPFATGTPEGGFIARHWDYDAEPRGGLDAKVTVKRYRYGGGVEEARATLQRDLDGAAQTSEPRSTETVAGIGVEAFYNYNDDDLTERQALTGRDGNVLFGAEITGAIGSRDAMKACLAAVVKKVMAATPAK